MVDSMVDSMFNSMVESKSRASVFAISKLNCRPNIAGTKNTNLRYTNGVSLK